MLWLGLEYPKSSYGCGLLGLEYQNVTNMHVLIYKVLNGWSLESPSICSTVQHLQHEQI